MNSTIGGARNGNSPGSNAPGGTPQDEVVEPMIPHKSREDVDLTPGPRKHDDKQDVVEPMIPHKKR